MDDSANELPLVITQVFPDEFHLNTLDQLLSAIARLNRNVNIKAIVIGLMDRLSSYAAGESESDSPEDRMAMEEAATAKLLERLQISQESKDADAKPNEPDRDQTNGEQTNGDKPVESSSAGPPETDGRSSADPESTAVNGEDEKSPAKKNRGIPEHIKLYEIFYDQVINLVNTQRLPIQDIIGLLVSLSHLAL